MDRLTWATKQYGIHVHLVAHCRKPQGGGEERKPGKYEILGTSSVSNMADQIIGLWTNKKRQRLLEAQQMGFTLDESQLKYIADNVDQEMIVCKNRHGGWEGNVRLYFDERSFQYNTREGVRIDFGLDEVITNETTSDTPFDDPLDCLGDVPFDDSDIRAKKRQFPEARAITPSQLQEGEASDRVHR